MRSYQKRIISLKPDHDIAFLKLMFDKTIDKSIKIQK